MYSNITQFILYKIYTARCNRTKWNLTGPARSKSGNSEFLEINFFVPVSLLVSFFLVLGKVFLHQKSC